MADLYPGSASYASAFAARAARGGAGGSAPESVPEKDSSSESATSEKDACARAALGQVYEQPKKWHFYADGLWLRATVLHLLNDR